MIAEAMPALMAVARELDKVRADHALWVTMRISATLLSMCSPAQDGENVDIFAEAMRLTLADLRMGTPQGHA